MCRPGLPTMSPIRRTFIQTGYHGRVAGFWERVSRPYRWLQRPNRCVRADLASRKRRQIPAARAVSPYHPAISVADLPSPGMTREQLFLSELASIERLISWVCVRRGLRGADAEDFGSVEIGR